MVSKAGRSLAWLALRGLADAMYGVEQDAPELCGCTAADGAGVRACEPQCLQ